MQREAAPARGDFSPLKGSVSPVRWDLAPAEGSDSPRARDLPRVQGSDAPAWWDFSPARWDSSPVWRDVIPVRRSGRPPAGNVRSAGRSGTPAHCSAGSSLLMYPLTLPMFIRARGDRIPPPYWLRGGFHCVNNRGVSAGLVGGRAGRGRRRSYPVNGSKVRKVNRKVFSVLDGGLFDGWNRNCRTSRRGVPSPQCE